MRGILSSPSFVPPVLPSLVPEPPVDNRPLADPRYGSEERKWIKPVLVVGVRHLRGAGALRHATVHDLTE